MPAETHTGCTALALTRKVAPCFRLGYCLDLGLRSRRARDKVTISLNRPEDIPTCWL